MAHSHSPGHTHEPISTQRLGFVCAANMSFAVVQVIVGLALGSVVVLADALHQVVDAIGIATALIAMLLTKRPASRTMSYGWGRADALGGYTSGLLLLGSIAWVVYESIDRLIDPVEVSGAGVVIIGVLGIIVNGASVWALGHAEALSLKAARIHLMVDLAGSVIVVLAGLVLIGTTYLWIDPAASLLINVLVLHATFSLLRASAGELLDRSPDDATVTAVESALLAQPGVESVHHVHTRALGPSIRSLTAHVVLEGRPDLHDAQDHLDRLTAELTSTLGIAHTTLQLECHECNHADH